MHVSTFVSNTLLRDAEQRIAHVIDNHGHKAKILSSKKQIIHYHRNGSQKNVFHLISGEVEVRNGNNSLIVANALSPAILGLSNMFSKADFFYMQTVTDVELNSITIPELIHEANCQGLWNDISVILSHYIDVYYKRDLTFTQSSVYNIIKTYLEALWEFEHDKLDQISVFDFILNRTQVSRSSLNKILKDLSLGGYIKMNRGKLISINKLPSKY